MQNGKLFLNYSIDCETPVNTPYTGGQERCSFFGGPASWAFAEKSVRGFVDLMTDLDAAKGATLFVYPDVAQEQKGLYREMADAGIEIALHLNGLRYSRLAGDRAKWLGAMTFQEQKDAISAARQDLEQVVGQPCKGYRACYGSANDDTFKILDELGFTWASNASGRHRLETFANWWGSWPYPHFSSVLSKLIPGDLDVFEVPVSRGIETFFEEDRNKPFDLRVESPVELIGEDRRILRQIIEENLINMQRMNVPVQAIAGASHNTSDYGDFDNDRSQNLRWLVRHARDLCGQHGLALTPASFSNMRDEARCVGSY
jgi:hypothetical protein